MSTSMQRRRRHTGRHAIAGLISLCSLVFVAALSGVASASPKGAAVDSRPGGMGSASGPQASRTAGDREVIGFDFSYTKPDARAMARAGYEFAIGYVSHNPAKNLTAGQVAAYRDAGIAVGLVWETTEKRALEGRTAGAQDGRAAEEQANALRYPVDAAIFFAVDTNTTARHYPAIQEYAEAFNAATRRPVGIFGEADVLDQFVTPGQQPVRYGWQTRAWSHGRVSDKADLYKRVGHPSREVPDGIHPKAFDEVLEIQPVPLAR